MSVLAYLKPILIFLLIIVYLGTLLYLCLKFPRYTPLKVELNLWIARPCCIGMLASLPIPIGFTYYVISYRDINLIMIIGIFFPVILFIIDLLFTNPKRKQLSQIADAKLAEIEVLNLKPENSFKAKECTEIYNQDFPIYASGSFLVGVAINRVFKNSYNEYFHIFCMNWNGWSDLEIKRINKDTALIELNKKH